YSLESFHNTVHVAMGYPMSTVAFAAFDLTFWMHHCNVDRIFQTYIEGDKAWVKTFSRGNPREYEDPLSPMKNPSTGRTYRCADFAEPERYERTYDVRYNPPNTSRNLLVSPVVVIFDDCDIMKFNGECYMIHVFVCHKNE